VNGPDRYVDQLGNLLIGECEHIFENHGDPVVRRQLHEQRLKVVGQIPGCHLGLDVRAALDDPVRLVRQRHRRTSLIFADTVQEGVGGDTAQPPFKVSRLIVFESSSHAQENLLN